MKLVGELRPNYPPWESVKRVNLTAIDFFFCRENAGKFSGVRKKNFPELKDKAEVQDVDQTSGNERHSRDGIIKIGMKHGILRSSFISRAYS